MPRFRITSLIVLVAIVAIGLAAMRTGSELVGKGVATLVLLSVLVSLTGAFTRKTGSWVGFSVFCLGFMLIRAATDGDLIQVALDAVAGNLHLNRAMRPPRPNMKSFSLPEVGVSFEQSWLDQNMEMPQEPGQSDEDFAIVKDYLKQLKLFFNQDDLAKRRQEHAMRIGNEFVILTLGWVGVIVGRYLEKTRSTVTIEQASLTKTT